MRTITLGSRNIRAGAIKTLTRHGSINVNGTLVKILWDFGSGLGELLGNFFSGIKKFFSWTATLVWSAIIQAKNILWNFNWNMSINDLTNELHQGLQILAGQSGALLGQGMGWLVCGALPGALMLQINPLLGAKVLAEVSEEAAEELASSIISLATTAFNLAGSMALKSYLMYLRYYSYVVLDNDIRNPGDLLWNITPLASMWALWEGKLPGIADRIKRYQTESKQPWTFAMQYEQWLDNTFGDGILREFIEEFFDEFSDSCTEAGFVVAGAFDSYFAEQTLQQNLMLGSNQVVQVQLTRN